MTGSARAARPYSKTALAGAAGACLVVLGTAALCGNSVAAFFSLGGLVIVVGGVIAVAFMSFGSADVRAALRAIGGVLHVPASDGDLRDELETVVKWAHVAREGGLRRLESSVGAGSCDDPFVRYGINMVLSEYAPCDVRRMMETAADGALERDSVPVDVLHAMTGHAPAFGMVGTLIGTVTMLCDLGGDVSRVGPALAVSFLSTLYGVVSARMVYMPAASRLQGDVEARRFRHGLMIEGIVMLAEKRSPSFIKDRLNGFLPPESHDYLDTIAGPAARPLRDGRSIERLGGFGMAAVGL